MPYRRNSDESLRRLERDLVNDPSLISNYVYSYIRAHERPPNICVPDIAFICLTHQQECGTNYRAEIRECPRTIWEPTVGRIAGHYASLDLPCQIEPRLRDISDWISWMGHPHNLFAIKKRDFPEPTTSAALLDRFAELHQNDLSFLLLGKKIMDFLTAQMASAVEFIANLRILPEVSNYPLSPAAGNVITWDQLVELTNLRVDLIKDYLPPVYERWFSRNMSFCGENVSPISVINYTVVERGRGDYFSTRFRGGVVMNSLHTIRSPQPVSLEMIWFG